MCALGDRRRVLLSGIRDERRMPDRAGLRTPRFFSRLLFCAVQDWDRHASYQVHAERSRLRDRGPGSEGRWAR